MYTYRISFQKQKNRLIFCCLLQRKYKIMLQPIYLPENLIFVFRNPKIIMNEYGTKTVPKLPDFP